MPAKIGIFFDVQAKLTEVFLLYGDKVHEKDF